MVFSYKKLLNYSENRYALAKACMEYSKKVRYLHADDCKKANDKDALVAIDHLLEGKVNFNLNRSEIELELSEDSLLLAQQTPEEEETEADDKELE